MTQGTEAIQPKSLRKGDQLRGSHSARNWWTVQVSGDRYTIISRQAPFKPKGDYQYSIIDWEEKVRGATNFVGNGWDVSQYKTPDMGWRALHIALLSGAVLISHRNQVTLDITEVRKAKP